MRKRMSEVSQTIKFNLPLQYKAIDYQTEAKQKGGIKKKYSKKILV